MRRYSILRLMGFILVLAVGLAALRDANDQWAGGMILATSLLIGIATLGGLFGADRLRAGRLGFAVFGGGYFALAFLGLSEGNLSKLPTTWLLAYVHQRVSPPQTYTFTVTGSAPGQTGQGLVLMSNVRPGPIANTVTTTTTSQASMASTVDPAIANRWKSLLPGAANYESFSVVGHCLFALLACLLGAAIARRFERGRIGQHSS
jgi:hypothetical protein